jgi:hypothetical protein
MGRDERRQGLDPESCDDYPNVFWPNDRVRFVGTAVIDGQAAYVISFTELNYTRSTATEWISKATMLPIKSVSRAVTVSYQWSGPGSVNPATAWPSVPAGFTKVDPRRQYHGVKLRPLVSVTRAK